MLALTRRAGEEIVIGDPDAPLGVIRIVTIHGDKVKLSFDFPREVKINRRELAEMKKTQKSQGDAADPAPPHEDASPRKPQPRPRPDDKRP